MVIYPKIATKPNHTRVSTSIITVLIKLGLSVVVLSKTRSKYVLASSTPNKIIVSTNNKIDKMHIITMRKVPFIL